MYVYGVCVVHMMAISMAMTQDTIDWKYLPYIWPFLGLCEGISPQKYGPTYGTVPPFWNPEMAIYIWRCLRLGDAKHGIILVSILKGKTI